MRKIALALLAAATLACPAQRLAILSDIHVTPGNENDRQLNLAVDEINAMGGIDAVVVNGDLTNEGSDEQLTYVKAILDRLALPTMIIPGNHENNWSQSATKTFPDLWGADRFAAKVDSLVVVGINCGPYMKMGDGHIKQEDLHWLDSTLSRMAGDGSRVLSFCHYALNPDLDNYQAYLDIVERYPVVVQVNGHYHAYKRYYPGDIEGLWVRALDMRGGNYGYTLMDVGPEWIRVYEKRIGRPEELRYVFPAATDHRPARSSAVAEAWHQPEGFEVTKVWADSASVFTRVAADAHNVYFGNSLGQAKAIDKATGAEAWSVQTPSSLYSRPVVLASGLVAIPHAQGILTINAADGSVVADYPSAEGPYVADGLATPTGYYQGGYKRMERRDPASGEPVWAYDSIFNYCQAAPVVDGGDLIFGAWDTNLRCLDAESGALRWVWNNGSKANMLGPGNVVPVVTSDKVIVVAPDRYMTALDRRTGAQLWRNKSHKYRESLGRSQDGTRAYAKTMDGELVAVDTTTPEFNELWTLDLGLGYEHAPCIVLEHDGVVYCGSRRGLVTAVDPLTRSVLWQLPLGVSETNGFDVDPTTGDVYVSLIEGTVFRISRR